MQSVFDKIFIFFITIYGNLRLVPRKRIFGSENQKTPVKNRRFSFMGFYKIVFRIVIAVLPPSGMNLLKTSPRIPADARITMNMIERIALQKNERA